MNPRIKLLHNVPYWLCLRLSLEESLRARTLQTSLCHIPFPTWPHRQYGGQWGTGCIHGANNACDISQGSVLHETSVTSNWSVFSSLHKCNQKTMIAKGTLFIQVAVDLVVHFVSLIVPLELTPSKASPRSLRTQFASYTH
eukprot:5294804-Amphidinium_carterae.1